MSVAVKICGLSDEAAVDAACEGGGRFAGFVFFGASPRAVTPKRAAELTRRVPGDVIRVALVVDADDALLTEITGTAGIDMLQLHGRETPERTAEVRERFGFPVMKVISVAGADDVGRAREYEDAADWLMFDAKPPESAGRPGGLARTFDWGLLKGEAFKRPWLLAGGLTVENLAQAVMISGAEAVDVSSGVEDAPGRKNPAKIREFLAAARAL